MKQTIMQCKQTGRYNECEYTQHWLSISEVKFSLHLSCCTIAQFAPAGDKKYDMKHFLTESKMFVKSILMLRV